MRVRYSPERVPPGFQIRVTFTGPPRIREVLLGVWPGHSVQYGLSWGFGGCGGVLWPPYRRGFVPWFWLAHISRYIRDS